jgi:hypothetical protein
MSWAGALHGRVEEDHLCASRWSASDPRVTKNFVALAYGYGDTGENYSDPLRNSAVGGCMTRAGRV